MCVVLLCLSLFEKSSAFCAAPVSTKDWKVLFVVIEIIIGVFCEDRRCSYFLKQQY